MSMNGWSFLAGLLVTATALAAVPTAEADSPFFSISSVSEINHLKSELVPGQGWKVLVTFEVQCRFNPEPAPDADQLSMVEHYSVTTSASDEYLQVADADDFQVQWRLDQCVGLEDGWSEHVWFQVRFEDGTPAFHRSFATLELDGAWGLPSIVSLQFIALPTGTLLIEAPQGVSLPAGGSAVVPLTITNAANTPLHTDLNPIVRGLNSPQPDVPPFVLEVGAIRTMDILIETTDVAPASGILDIRWQAGAADDPDEVVDQGRTRIDLAVSDDPAPASLDVSEAPLAVTPVFGLTAFGLSLMRRRW